MSNYLANLAARTLNLTRPVFPRLRGRFEPAFKSGESPLIQTLSPDRTVFEALPVQTELAVPSPTKRQPHPRQPVRNSQKLASPSQEISLDMTADEPGSQSQDLLESPRSQPSHIRVGSEETPRFAESRIARSQPAGALLRENATESSSVTANTDRGKTTSLVNDTGMASSSNPERRTESLQLERVRGTRLLDNTAGASRGRPFEATIDEPELAASLAKPRPNKRLLAQSQTMVPEERSVADVTQPDRNLNSPSSTISRQRQRPADVSPTSNVSVVIAGPPITPLVEGRRSMSALDHTGSSASQPTVQVTIGRIEVRAVQSAPPPSTRQRAAPPVMNLDDYLRQRSGGTAR